MNNLIRTALIAALALPLTLPAVASTTGVVRLPAGWHGPQMGQSRTDPQSTFARLYAQRQPAVAHFNFPYALAADKFGNLFVANANSNIVKEVTPGLRVLPGGITQSLSTPFSIAVDTTGNVYVGNETGNVEKFSSTGSFIQTITANTSYPQGIAVDQFQDLFVLSAGGVGIDDSTGATIFTNVFSSGQQLFSVAAGGPNVYAFYSGAAGFGNGSAALRLGSFQFLAGPLTTQQPIGSACLATGCWFDDAIGHTLSFGNFPGGTTTISLAYPPAGIAYDPIHNRLFVADPTHNAIQIYNATTLVFEKTLV